MHMLPWYKMQYSLVISAKLFRIVSNYHSVFKFFGLLKLLPIVDKLADCGFPDARLTPPRALVSLLYHFDRNFRSLVTVVLELKLKIKGHRSPGSLKQ